MSSSLERITITEDSQAGPVEGQDDEALTDPSSAILGAVVKSASLGMCFSVMFGGMSAVQMFGSPGYV